MRLLVPENEVPPFVVECMKEENEKDAKDGADFLEYVKEIHRLGLDDDNFQVRGFASFL